MQADHVKAGQRVQVTGRYAKQLEQGNMLGLKGTVQDPALSAPHGFVRVLFDQAPAGLVGIQNIHPESLQPEGAPPPGQSVTIHPAGSPLLSPDIIPSRSARPPRQHRWHKYRRMVCCADCGVVKRADGQNSPCRGVVKVGPRSRPPGHCAVPERSDRRALEELFDNDVGPFEEED